MLLLGVLAAQAEAAPAGVAAYDLLETEILTGSQASVTFSSLNSTYGSTYQHLQIRVVAKTDRTSATVDFLDFILNATGGTSYASHRLLGDGSAVESNASTSASVARIARVSGNNDSSIYGAAVIDFLDAFDTNKNTTIRAFSGAPNTSLQVVLASGLFNNTAAIDSIKIEPELGTNLLQYSRFSLYGLKAA